MRWLYGFLRRRIRAFRTSNRSKPVRAKTAESWCLDGPTFMATEGWDWIPAIRDRNTGLWQDVVLTATGQVKIGDPQRGHKITAAGHEPR